MHVEIFGTHIALLGSLAVIQDLFQKRGGIYSDRPGGVVASMAGFDQALAQIPYNDQLKHGRRMVTKSIGPRALAKELMPLLSQTVQDFVLNILGCPDRFVEYLRLWV